MSIKEFALRIVGELPDEVTAPDLVSAVVAGLQGADEYDAAELAPDEWAALVAHGLREELNDPREDVYTLEDGTPPDDPR